MLYRFLVSIALIFTTIPTIIHAWRVQSYCSLCDSSYYIRANDIIRFTWTDVPSNITGFDIYLAYGTSAYNWTAVSVLGTNVEPPSYYTVMPSDVITSSRYYFIVDSIGWETRATVGPLDVLSSTAIDPYATTTTTTTTTRTTTTYAYPSATRAYEPTNTPFSPADDDWEDYQSQIHALYIGRIVGSVVGSVVGLAILIGVFFYMRRRNRRLLAQQKQQQKELPPVPMYDGGFAAVATGSSSPPMTQMYAIPVPAHEQPQEPPQPGYYYAMLTPQQPPAAFVSGSSEPHLSMPMPVPTMPAVVASTTSSTPGGSIKEEVSNTNDSSISTSPLQHNSPAPHNTHNQ